MGQATMAGLVLVPITQTGLEDDAADGRLIQALRGASLCYENNAAPAMTDESRTDLIRSLIEHIRKTNTFCYPDLFLGFNNKLDQALF